MADKTVLITGAARRIGAAIARYLHAKRFNVVIHYNRSTTEAKQLVDDLNGVRPGSARTVQADLLAASSYGWVIDKSLELTGSLDVLVNNASVFYPTLLQEIQEPTWDEVVGANLKAPLFLARCAAPHLEQSRGCVVNITDVHGNQPLSQHSIYSAAKSGVNTLTRALAQELAPNVRVNAVSPGAILWPEELDDETKNTILSTIPLQRQGNPVDIAKAVYFLIAEADYVTGQILAVDGGYEARGQR